MSLATIRQYDATSWEHRIPRRCLVDRDATILSVCSGKRVLHLGAADAPFHETKGSRGQLLHQKLRGVARSVVGLDTDAGAVQWLRDNLGIDDIRVADATRVDDDLGKFDVVLCCDIIEHVVDVGSLLGFCRNHLRESGIVVVTTINATALKPALRALLGREAVHFDHTCYFSFATLCQLALRVGLRPMQFGTFTYPTVTGVARWLFDTAARLAPGTADGLLLVAQGSEGR